MQCTELPSCPSVRPTCPSVRAPVSARLLLDGFPWNLIVRILWKSVVKIHAWLKSSKNIWQFTCWRHTGTSALSSNSWYQAVRIAEEKQTLCERVRMLRYTHVADTLTLTFWCRNYFFFNFSTSCIQNVNNTGTKDVSIMKQTAFWREKSGEYRACLKYSVPTFVE